MMSTGSRDAWVGVGLIGAAVGFNLRVLIPELPVQKDAGGFLFRKTLKIPSDRKGSDMSYTTAMISKVMKYLFFF